jgi:hypothetical protein
VGLNSLKSLNLTNGYPNNNNKNKVKSKPLELFELAGKNVITTFLSYPLRKYIFFCFHHSTSGKVCSYRDG